jgi:hypothetical protein
MAVGSEATIEWLLAGDAAIRWQVMADLLEQPAVTVEQERSRVETSGWGKRLLDLRDESGTWDGGLYGPKWTSTNYTLLLLMRCGLPPGNKAALEGVELLWDGARYFDGGLTGARTIDAPEACITSMYLALAFYFGFEDDRVPPALEWLLGNQLRDGGWNCQNVRTGDKHSSFHTSISALEALAQAKQVRGTPEIEQAMDIGREFFLRHRLYRSHRTGEVADPAFTRLSFPPRWHYDILRALDHFQSVDSTWDSRFGDALGELNRRRRNDGLWPVQQKYPGRVWFDMEKTGGPSRWNTLRGLRVLRWAERAAPQAA